MSWCPYCEVTRAEDCSYPEHAEEVNGCLLKVNRAGNPHMDPSGNTPAATSPPLWRRKGSEQDLAPNWLVDAADLLAEPDPGPTAFLVEDLIVDKALIAAVGRWKTTKSYGLLEIAIAIAVGRPAFGKLEILDPGPVVFINEESGRAALWRRLDALCRGRGTNPDELRRKLYVAANARVKLDDTGWQNELLTIGREIKPRLILFDPLARMKSAHRDESAQNEMAAVIEYLRHLRDETDSAVSFVQHVGHTGDHMRGSSDLESVWETRLAWKREGESPIVELESAHREAESVGTIKYRIDWDHETRSIRFELETDPLEAVIADYLHQHPDASANEVDDNVEGNRKTILALVKRLRSEGGSEPPEPPGTTPLRAPVGVVPPTPPPPLGGGGWEPPTTPGSEKLEPPLFDDDLGRR